MPTVVYQSVLARSFEPPPPDSFTEEVKQVALSSIAKVTAPEGELGCGVLIGIDRVIIPLHVISTQCPENLCLLFSSEITKQSYPFQILRFLIIDPKLDFAVAQIGSAVDGSFPGNLFCFPRVSCASHQGPFVLSSFENAFPSLQFGQGEPCGLQHFCSEVATTPGCSGGGYLNRDGDLFAIHLSRSTGACEPFNPSTRRALYLQDAIRKYPLLFSFPICQPICPPRFITPCAPVFMPRDICFSEEGRPVVYFKMQNGARTYHCSEWKPTNGNGAGPRGLTVKMPEANKECLYRFTPNPHGIKAYNKNQQSLYQTAARHFIVEYERVGQLPPSFEFEEYGETFKATLH